MNLTKRETATVLAALRNWQSITSEEGGNDPREIEPDFFDEVTTPLSTEEIDKLCRDINLQ